MGHHAFGYIEDGKLFLKGFLEYPAREIGEVKDNEASTIQYFEEKFKVLKNKVDEMEQIIQQAENKGSYLMKLLHFKRSLATADALGDFETLYKRLEKQENVLVELIAENRKKNLEIKTALLQEAEGLAGTTNWKEDGEKIRELRSKWVKTGNVDKEHEEAIEGKFADLVNDFFLRRKAFFEERNEIISKRLLTYRDIIRKAREASGLAPGKAIKELMRLQQAWKEVGRIPAPQLDPLWDEFRAINDEVFQHKQRPVKIMRGKTQNDLSEAERMDEKKVLLQKAKVLNQQQESDALTKVKMLRSAWKKLGRPSKDHRKIDDNFFFTCEMVVEKNFINELIRHKFRGQERASEEEKRAVKVKILRDLLTRDQSELETFKENMAKMTINTDAAYRLMNAQLRLQTRKVRVKKAILEELTNIKDS